jgi:hypothetical protein
MLTALGTPLPIPGTWLSTPSNGLAVGILSTSRDSLTPFAVTWDFLAVELGHPPAP